MSPANLTNTLDHLNISNVVGLPVHNVYTSIRNPFGLALLKALYWDNTLFTITAPDSDSAPPIVVPRLANLPKVLEDVFLSVILKKGPIWLLPCVSFVPWFSTSFCD